jgi:hypothetical protein
MHVEVRGVLMSWAVHCAHQTSQCPGPGQLSSDDLLPLLVVLLVHERAHERRHA